MGEPDGQCPCCRRRRAAIAVIIYADDPEAVVAMLACARIGAIHSIVFAGFRPTRWPNRINDCAKVVITADTAPRGGRRTALKSNADAALHCSEGALPGGQKHTGGRPPGIDGRDVGMTMMDQVSLPDCPPRR